jgi:hypothetical protein
VTFSALALCLSIVSASSRIAMSRLALPPSGGRPTRHGSNSGQIFGRYDTRKLGRLAAEFTLLGHMKS